MGAAGRWEHELLKVKKSDYYKDQQVQQSKLNNMLGYISEELRALLIYDEIVAESINDIKKLVGEKQAKFDKTEKTNIDDKQKIKKELAAIIKIYKDLKILEEKLQEGNKLLDETEGFSKFSLPCPRCKGSILFDASKPEIKQKIKSLFGDIMHPECRLKNEQPKRVTLKPVSYSGEPIFQSGFSPVIQSGEQVMSVGSSGVPVLQSGCYI